MASRWRGSQGELLREPSPATLRAKSERVISPAQRQDASRAGHLAGQSHAGAKQTRLAIESLVQRKRLGAPGQKESCRRVRETHRKEVAKHRAGEAPCQHGRHQAGGCQLLAAATPGRRGTPGGRESSHRRRDALPGRKALGGRVGLSGVLPARFIAKRQANQYLITHDQILVQRKRVGAPCPHSDAARAGANSLPAGRLASTKASLTRTAQEGLAHAHHSH